MLENLVANFEYPCIIDLKMGTRLHDDNATETKKQSHESKVNETTSGALGLRITGIQVQFFFKRALFSMSPVLSFNCLSLSYVSSTSITFYPK